MIKNAIFFIVLSCWLSISYADRIAIIGGGASGVVSAWLLEGAHDVSLYESSNRLGGHANTIEINVGGEKAVIEAGAEYFNELAYPHFLKLLRYYQIPLHKFTLVTTFYTTDGKDMIILPPYHDGTVEWKSLTPTNISRSLQMKMLIDRGREVIGAHDTQSSTEAIVNSMSLTTNFKSDFLYPLLASAWGVTPNEVRDFSAYNTLKYLVNGYDSKNYQWYEATNGLSEYIQVIRQNLQHTDVHLNAKVTAIRQENGKYIIEAEDGSVRNYDQIVFATDANVASKLIANSNLTNAASLSATLAQVRYYDTNIAIHSDRRFMPEHKEDWRVVNIRYDGQRSAMSMYKEWKSNTPIFKTWLTYDVRSPSDQGSPKPDNLYALVYYRHAATDSNYFKTQREIHALQGNNHVWFAGVWTQDNDSHESAIDSAMYLGEQLSPYSPRLQILK